MNEYGEYDPVDSEPVVYEDAYYVRTRTHRSTESLQHSPAMFSASHTSSIVSTHFPSGVSFHLPQYFVIMLLSSDFSSHHSIPLTTQPRRTVRVYSNRRATSTYVVEERPRYYYYERDPYYDNDATLFICKAVFSPFAVNSQIFYRKKSSTSNNTTSKPLFRSQVSIVGVYSSYF